MLPNAETMLGLFKLRVYEASVFAVPFLIEMLKSPEVVEKTGIALLLAEMADGSGGLELFANDDEISRKFRVFLKQEGRDFPKELKQERDHVQATRKAVGLGIELLFDYLAHEEPSVREAVARALARYPERADEILLLLEHAREKETEDYVQDAIDASLVKIR